MDSQDDLRARLNDADPGIRREACSEIGAGMAIAFLPDLVRALNDADPSVKEASLDSLASIGGSVAAQAVAPLLRSQDSCLRNAAVEVLERIGPASIDTIAAVLSDDDDDVVKFGVDILANISDERATDLLFRLSDHRNPNVRASVAVCLGRLQEPSACAYLLKALSDGEQWVRFSAVEGLGYLGSPAALPELLKLIETDSVTILREAAIDAIGKIAAGSDAASVLVNLEAPIRNRQVFNVLAVCELLEKACSEPNGFRPSMPTRRTYMAFFSDAMKNGDQGEQKAALRGIGLIGTQEAVPEIFGFARAQKELDDEIASLVVEALVRVSGHAGLPDGIKEALERGGSDVGMAIKAVAALKSAEAVPFLARLLPSAAKDDLREIVIALEAIGSFDSIKALRVALKSRDGHARKTAARALSRLEGEYAATELFAALENEIYRDVIEEITDALAVIPSEAVRTGFCRLLGSDKPILREMGARGLGPSGNEQSLEDLAKAAADGVSDVRKAAYRSVARLGIPEGIDLIARGLQDMDVDVRLCILKALGGWSGPAVEELIESTFKDSNVWVRYHCAVLLGDLGGPNAERLLIERLLVDEAPVKAACAAALERLGAQSALPVLESLIDYPDDNVRAAVENAIGGLGC